jgi:hypothetical protein
VRRLKAVLRSRRESYLLRIALLRVRTRLPRSLIVCRLSRVEPRLCISATSNACWWLMWVYGCHGSAAVLRRLNSLLPAPQEQPNASAYQCKSKHGTYHCACNPCFGA